MNFISQKTKLIDCLPKRSADQDRYRELFLVEGDSASKAVARVRDHRFQAVLPMQGKPMNATKSSEKAVRRNLMYGALVDALGVGWHAERISEMRYDRVNFLFDPDADGIHCGALMLMFFDTYLRPVLDANRVSLIKPPLFAIRATGYQDMIHALTEDQSQKISSALNANRIEHTRFRYRGLAGIDDQTLAETCVNPNTRTAYLLRHVDACAAHSLFGRGHRSTET